MGALQRGWDLVSGKVARESKERFEEAQRIVDDAKERYEKTVDRFEAASQQARVIADAYGEYHLEFPSLESLRLELKAWNIYGFSPINHR